MPLFKLLNRIENDDRLMPHGVLLLRLTLAALWAAHWVFKFFITGMDATVATFAKLGYPAIVAWGTVSFEVAAVVALALGLYTRVFALAGLVVMFPAMLVWIPKGFWFTQAGFEFPLVWCLLQIVLAVTGPGALAIRSIGQNN